VRDARDTRSDTVAISTRASSHEPFSRARVHGLETDVAFLALCVLGARLRRDRDGLRVLLIRMKLFGPTSLFNLPTELVVAALFPVLFLAFGPTVARAAAAAFLPQG